MKLKKEYTLEDIEEIEPEIYKSLLNLKTSTLTQESGFSFVVNYQSWEQNMEKELIQNGADISVTENNKLLFIEKYLEWILEESIKV